MPTYFKFNKAFKDLIAVIPIYTHRIFLITKKTKRFLYLFEKGKLD